MLRTNGLLCCVLAIAAAGCAQVDPPKKGEIALSVQANVSAAEEPLRVNSTRAMQYAREIVAFGRRAPGSPGQLKQQAYLRAKLKQDNLEEDTFKAKTPVGEFELTNFIAKFPGTTNDVIVISSHYDTNYPLKNYVGANDGASSTALLLELANQFRGHKRTGPAVWLVWFDGEEAFKEWTDEDSIYGSRHLAAKWQQDGTIKRIKAFILADMIGDADLNIEHDGNSTPWLNDLVYKAATNLSKKSYFFKRDLAVGDDHTPFAKAGVPVVDLIDFDYGYNNVYWHTSQDTLDKISPKSLQIVGDVILETVRLLNSGH
jgi:Zn-dependent M28 family amino/carboxypeptidase